MADPRVTKLAQVLVNYSLDIQPGEEFVIQTGPQARELSLAVYKEALLAGAHPQIFSSTPGAAELFFKYANDEQIDYISPVRRLIAEQFTATLSIGAAHNTRELSAIDPNRQSRARKAGAELSKLFMERSARKELKWCYTVFPTNASAQDADMSLADYEDFIYTAGLLNLGDPVAAWQEEGKRQKKLIDWLKGKDRVEIKGANVELSLSIKDRSFVEADGRYNFPDGEIFTGPVEASANGWIRYAYPAIYGGREVTNIELWFEEGKVVKEKADKGQDLLTTLLNTDDGSRFLGEWGIGTNYNIQTFTKNMLFDEKMGGTIHLALGAGYPETGSKNNSGIHWDMLCDMAESEITVDGELFYKDGHPVI